MSVNKKNLKITLLVVLAVVIISALILILKPFGSKENNKFKLIEYYISKQEYESAQKLLESILLTDPENAKAKELLDFVINEKKNRENIATDENSNKNEPVIQQIVIVPKEAEQAKQLPTAKETDKNDKQKIDEKQKQYEELLKKGEAEYKNGNYLADIEYFNEALKIKNDDYRVYQDLAYSYYASDDGSLENYQKIQKNAEKGLQLNPDAYELDILLGQIYYKSKLYEKAKDSFQKALSKNPKSIEASVGLMLSYAALSDIENAKKVAENILSRDSQNLEANQFLGSYYYKKENWDKAAEHLSKAYLKDSSNKETICMLAKAYYMQKRYQEVVDLVSKSTNTEPVYVEEAMWGGMAYEKLGNLQQAIKFFEKSVNCSNSFDESYIYKSYFNYGLFLKKQNDFYKAITMFSKVAEMDKNLFAKYPDLEKLNKSSFTEIGYCYFSLKDYESAITYYEKAVNSGEKSYSTFFNLGFAYYKAKTKQDLNKSVTYFGYALNENKNTSDVETRNDNYAKTYTLIANIFVANDKPKAYTYYNQAVKFSSSYLETYVGILECIIADKDKKLVDSANLLKIIETGSSRIKYTVETKSSVGNAIKLFYLKAGIACYSYELYEPAYNNCAKAIEIDKKYGDAYDYAIQALIQLKRYKEAVALIDIYLGFASEQKKTELLKILEEISSKS